MKLKSVYRFIFVVAGFSLPSYMMAEIPAGYYSGLNGKYGSELKTATRNVIYPHTEVSSYSALPSYFQRTDVYPRTGYGDKNGRWWDMYSNLPLYPPSFSGLNREHAFPKSWWGGSTSTPAYVDLNHLYPSEMEANTKKSNYPLGTVQRATFDNGVVRVGSAVAGQGGGAGAVFEPADEYKGDFARTYFYMVTCYQDLSWKHKFMLVDGVYPTLNQWSQDLLLQWHHDDPVSQKEIDRNEVVYSIQNNRNPFIDFPLLADHIWGAKRYEPFYTNIADTPTGTPTLITPVQNMSIDFGEVAIGSSLTARLNLRGENLTGSLSLIVARDGMHQYSVSESAIAARLVNNTDGYWVTVRYNPQELGEHNGSLAIFDGGLSGSVSITLHGQCLPVPVLSTVKATDPSDITATSYVANWEAPSNEVIDYYIVTRTRYVGGQTSTEELIAETSQLEITDFDHSDSESYYVQSTRLGHRSDPSNIIFVAHSGIRGLETDSPVTVCSTPGGISISSDGNVSRIRIVDITGRIVASFTDFSGSDTISLSSGVYLVEASGLPSPVKVIVNE